MLRTMTGGWGLLQAFAVALGVDLGGALLAAAMAALAGEYPLRTLVRWADELKLWGAVAALGGSFEPLKNIELGLFTGQLRLLARQVVYIAAALAGAHAGYLMLRSLAGPGASE